MKKPHFTLPVKFLVLITATAVLTAVSLSAYYYTAIKAEAIAELKAKGRSVTNNLAHNSESGVLFSDTQHLSLLIKLLAEDSDVVSAEVRSNDGDALVSIATNPRFTETSNNKLMEHIEQTGDPSGMRMIHYRLRDNGVRLFEFLAPITTRRVVRDREEIGFMFNDIPTDNYGREVQIGTARVIFSSARPFRELRRIQRNIVGIAAAATLASILVTVPLVRITVKPIRQLAEGTKKIAAGDLSQRVVATTGDEIEELANCFNQMTVDLQKYHAELEEYNRTLEERVRERTHELKGANEELELANAELRKAQAQLIQAGKMAAMGQFGAGVAHELNQPLAGIKGYAQLLLTLVDEGSPIRRHLLQIDKQASRMKEITQTMWNLARQSKFEYGFLDIREPIRDSLILISEQFRQHQIEIIEEIENNLPHVCGDANQLHQVFLNLLTNAKDAIDEREGGRIKIKVFPVAEGRYLQALVMDVGSGIPSDIMENIFNPFFTTKAPGKGSGLGLSINYSIIQQHHGFIEVHSEESKGTAFSVILPTETFKKCTKYPDETDAGQFAPCWVRSPGKAGNADLRRPDCKSCEIHMRYQSPPGTEIASEFARFIAG